MPKLVFFKSNNLKCDCGKQFTEKKKLEKHKKACSEYMKNVSEAMCNKKYK